MNTKTANRLIVWGTAVLVVLLGVWWLYFNPPVKVPNYSKYSDPKYASQIQVETYLMTREQLEKLFANPSEPPEQWIPPKKESMFQETSDEPIYLVSKIRNTGSKHAWGEILFKYIDPNWRPIKRFQIPELPPRMNIDGYYAMPIHVFAAKSYAEGGAFTWSQLYTISVDEENEQN